MTPPWTILFDSFHLYHLPQFDPVIELLRQDSRLRVVLSTSAANKPEEIRLTETILKHKGLDVILAETEEERARAIRKLAPEVFICGWSRYPLREFVPDSTLVGMIYHGIGVKPSYWLDNDERLDIRFVEGPYRMTQLREKGVTTDLALTGFAKLDPLFGGNFPSRDTLLTEMGLDPQKKTILYAPTFYPSSFGRFKESLGEQTRDYNLIIKLHMWVYFLSQFAGISMKPQRKLVEKFIRQFSHIHVVQPEVYNIIPYYQAADLLLTEASSTIYEMAAMDKPIIVARFYQLRASHRLFNGRLYRRRLDAGMSREVSDFCIELNKPQDLEMTLKRAFDQPTGLTEKHKKYQDDMLYKLDGKASQRIVEAIVDRLSRS